MPADFNNETIDGYAGLNEKYPESKVIETYGNISVDSLFASGRAESLIPGIDLEKFADYIEHSKKNNIQFNYTFNPPTIQNQEFKPEGINRIKELLKILSDLDIFSITVSIPSLIEVVKYLDDRFKIRASTICSITTVNEALAFKRMGVDKIVVKESINRKFDTLKAIVDNFGDEVEVITNVICHQTCIYRVFHYLQDSFDKGNKEWGYDYYLTRCVQRMINDPVSVLKFSWIRPEDIHKYEEIGIKYFKVQGRQSILKGEPVKMVEHYFQESFEGDLMKLLWMFSSTHKTGFKVDNKKLDKFLTPFVKNDNFCSDNCVDCKYCYEYAKKCFEGIDNIKYTQDFLNSSRFDGFKAFFEKNNK